MHEHNGTTLRGFNEMRLERATLVVLLAALSPIGAPQAAVQVIVGPTSIPDGEARAVIRAVRDWGKVTIATVYTLRSDADYVDIQTTMKNGGNVALPDLLSGHTLWTKGGFLFPVPGLARIKQGSADAALSDRVVAYDEDASISPRAGFAAWCRGAMARRSSSRLS